jgi:hypothetical protein
MIADATQNWKVGRPRTEWGRSPSPFAMANPRRRTRRKVAKEGRDEPQLFIWDTTTNRKSFTYTYHSMCVDDHK